MQGALIEAAVLNIVAIGATNTSGWAVGPQDAYPARLQALLRKKGIPANVINAGSSATQLPACFGASKARRPSTNIVILQPGANDLRFGFSKEQRTANIAAMVKRLRRWREWVGCSTLAAEARADKRCCGHRLVPGRSLQRLIGDFVAK